MRIDFDFSDLEAFLAVKETGSFLRAAERLNLSQSAITRRIQKLEAALDSPLFERTTRAVKPTLAARRLQGRAEAILNDARAMRDESVAPIPLRSIVVTVAAVATVVPLLLAPAIAAFRAEGHTARIGLRDGAANDVAEAVAQGEADFGICSIPSLDANTAFEPLFDDAIVLALSAGHPLEKHGAIRWADLEREALILPARGTGNRLLIDEAMARARLPLDWTYTVSRSATALALVAQGVGVALVPRSLMMPEPSVGTVFRPLAAPGIVRPVGLLTRIGQRDSADVSALKDMVRAMAAGR